MKFKLSMKKVGTKELSQTREYYNHRNQAFRGLTTLSQMS